LMVGCQTGKATTRMVPSCSTHPGEVGGEDVWGWVGGWWARNCSGAVSRAREPPPRAPPLKSNDGVQCTELRAGLERLSFSPLPLQQTALSAPPCCPVCAVRMMNSKWRTFKAH
jgi:hypothetical protein